MRRLLAWWSLAITSLIVIAFLVPLGLAVHNQSEQRAIVAAERDAEEVTALLALAITETGNVDPETLGARLGALPEGVAVSFPDGTRLGEVEPNLGLVEIAANESRAIADLTGDLYETAVPVLTSQGAVVVSVRVPGSELHRGVVRAWFFLGMLGVVIVGAAVFVSDRLGRTLVKPVDELAGAARRLGSGDLDVQVDVTSPPELQSVGEAFNWLAGRVRELIASEREQLADLSHRLRTPLTAARLQVEQLPNTGEREAVLVQIDRLRDSIDELITEMRSRPSTRNERCDLAAIARERMAFWSVLANEQDRPATVQVPSHPVHVPLPPEEVTAVIDSLLGNVFAHTPAGAAIEVTVVGDLIPELLVSDRGPGFPDDIEPTRRGVSGGGSTGLGLDIARKAAEKTGGRLEFGNRDGGGAMVHLRFGSG